MQIRVFVPQNITWGQVSFRVSNFDCKLTLFNVAPLQKYVLGFVWQRSRDAASPWDNVWKSVTQMASVGLVSGLRSGNKYLHIPYLYAASSELIGAMTYGQDAENSSHLQTSLHDTDVDGFIHAFRGNAVYLSRDCCNICRLETRMRWC